MLSFLLNLGQSSFKQLARSVTSVQTLWSGLTIHAELADENHYYNSLPHPAPEWKYAIA